MLTPFILPYVNGVQPILNWYPTTKYLSPGAFLFTSDADAMYDTIGTYDTTNVIGDWMNNISSSSDFPSNYLLRAITAGMVTIMQNNHFEFRDLNILQLLGTTIGTCLYVGYYIIWCTQV